MENKPGSISKETNNNSGTVVSEDQLQSAHPGLISQFSGKLTSACIWAAQVMVEHFSKYNLCAPNEKHNQSGNFSSKIILLKIGCHIWI